MSSTTVILAPGACRRGALSSTSCVENVSVGSVCSVVLSSARLDFVGRHVTLELFACNGVPEKLLKLPLWTEAPLS